MRCALFEELLNNSIRICPSNQLGIKMASAKRKFGGDDAIIDRRVQGGDGELGRFGLSPDVFQHEATALLPDFR